MDIKKTWLFVLPWSLEHVGGVNQVVINLARQMLENGTYHPLILISDWSAKEPVFKKEQGFDTVYWRIRPSDNFQKLKSRIVYKFSLHSFSSKLRDFCIDYGVEVINFHYVGGTAFSVVDALQHWDNDIQVLLSFHGTDVITLENMSNNDLKRWRQFLPRQYSITCSKGLGYRLEAIIGSKCNITVIYNGLDFNLFSEYKSTVFKNNEKIILTVGKYVENKGHKFLIEAFSRCKEEYANLRLILIGGSGDELSNIKKLVVNKNLVDSVDIIQDLPHDKLLSYYSNADIFVLPSLNEAFGIVVLEAGYFSLPVVASKVGGVPEIITDGVNGVFVEPGMTDQLEKSIKELLNSPEKLNELGASLRKNVLANFSWKVAHDKYIHLIDSD